MKNLVMPGIKRAFTALISAQFLLTGYAHGENNGSENENVYREYLIDTSLPFSEGATEEITDVRSPFVWQTYQAGIIDGWHYRFSPDGSAIFGRSPRLHDDIYKVSCKLAHGCTITGPDGNPVSIGPSEALLPVPSESNGLSIAKSYISWIFKNSKTLRSSFSSKTEKPTGKTSPPGADKHENEIHLPKKMEKTPAENKASPSNPTATPPKAPQKNPDRKNTKPTAQIKKNQNTAQKKTNDRPTIRKAADQVATSPPDNNPIHTFTKKDDKSTSCAISTEYGIKYYDDASEKNKSGKEKLSLTCASMFFSNITMRGTVNYYPDHNDQQPWDPDYTFSLAYHYSKSINLEYSNYSGNRFPWHNKDGTGALGSGSFRISYAIPDSWNKYIDSRLSSVNSLRCATSAATSPEYQKENGSGNLKTVLGISCSFSPLDISRLNIVFSGLYYPISDQQQSWDPDYTLNISYKVSDKLSLGYSNYSGGRWPWNKDPGVGEGLAKGSLRMTYKLD